MPNSRLLSAIGGLALLSALVLGCNGFFSDDDDGGGGVTARFVYVANSGSNNISGFVANTTTGALTAATNSPYTAGTSPESVGSDDQGRFLFAANSAGGVSFMSGCPRTTCAAKSAAKLTPVRPSNPNQCNRFIGPPP